MLDAISRRSLASFVTVAFVVGRDALALSPRASLAVGGAVGALLLAALFVDAVLDRLARSSFARRSAKWACLAALCVPVVFGLWRLWAARDAVGGVWPLGLLFVVGPPVAVVASRRLQLPSSGRNAAPARLVWPLLVASSFVWVHVALDTFVGVRPGTGPLHLGLFAGTLVASVALVEVLIARSAHADVPRGLRVASLLAGLALLEADRRLLLGLYAPMHVWLGVLGILCVDTGLGGLVSRLPPRVVRWAGGGGGALLVAAAITTLVSAARLADPSLRAELAMTPSGTWIVETTAAKGRRPRASASGARALRVPQYLDEPSLCPQCNILLVTIDALRADQIGRSGKPNDDAPRLARFAAQAVRFRRAYTQGGHTAIALAALMTGRWMGHLDWELWPYKGGKLYDPRTTDHERVEKASGRLRWSALPRIANADLLADRLRRAGYFTIATPFAGKNDLRPGLGLERGFRRYQDLSDRGWHGSTARKVVDLALAQRERTSASRWFQWVHLYDPHEARGDRDRYRGLVRSADSGFGLLLAALDREPDVAGRTVVIVLADHGEAFGEHGQSGHGGTPFEEQVRIPMLIRIPGVEPRDERHPVAAIDATATILATAGADTRGLRGVNLTALIARGAYPTERPIFVETLKYFSSERKPTRDLKALVLGDSKLIVDRLREAQMVFDLRRDPAEEQNLFGRRPRLGARLRSILDAFVVDAEGRHPLP